MDITSITDIKDNNERYDFKGTLRNNGIELTPISIDTLWVNITHRCNQECTHCHVGASPQNTEEMTRETMDECLQVLALNDRLQNLDITGGAPEMNPNFEYFVLEARKLNKHVIVRHNLTITFDGDQYLGISKAHLPAFFAENGIEILASLPYFNRDYTNRVRGQGVFEKSIKGLEGLNKLGYGKPNTGLILNLVYNHDGPLLPADRDEIEAQFHRALEANFGLVFNSLFAVTNMPINRFFHSFADIHSYYRYADNLVANFSPVAAEQVVCRSLISVGYDGRLYDCDFNQMLNMQVFTDGPCNIHNFDFEKLLHRKMKFGPHCFGCTAGGGSS